MAGGAAWAGSEVRCTWGWTDCSDCSVSMLGAEEAVRDHNSKGIRSLTRCYITSFMENIFLCIFTLLILAGVGCVSRGGAVVVVTGGSWAWCWVAAPVMGIFWTEMPCGVMWWI